MTYLDMLDHPVIAAALALHGLKGADFADDAPLRTGTSIARYKANALDVPLVSMQREAIAVQWNGSGLSRFRAYHDKGWWMVGLVLARAYIPDTVLTAAIGRRLGDIVSIEGGDDLVITGFERQGSEHLIVFDPIPYEERIP